MTQPCLTPELIKDSSCIFLFTPTRALYIRYIYRFYRKLEQHSTICPLLHHFHVSLIVSKAFCLLDHICLLKVHKCCLQFSIFSKKIHHLLPAEYLLDTRALPVIEPHCSTLMFFSVCISLCHTSSQVCSIG